MQILTIGDILKATGGELLSGDIDKVITGITTDSRNTDAGTLFVPIIGEKFDGHEFIQAAFDQGAQAAITQKETELLVGKTIIKVNDTFKALGDIARFYKERYNVPTVAVTGSVGKTTTKDMLYSALSGKYNTLKTERSFNNEIGLPLTVFRLEKEHEAIVLEMGMNHFGEIERLASIGRPDVAVITNIGQAHIEHLGSREGIFKAKMEIAKLFTEKNTLIVNGDDDFLGNVKGTVPCKVLYYGINNPENDVYAKDIRDGGLDGIEFAAVTPEGEYKIKVNVPGEHNVYNALAAICVGREFNVPMEKIIEGIENFELTEMRMAVEEYEGITIINDCFNASPDSIKAAVKVLGKIKDKRKIAILGDMLEMGDYAERAHYELGKALCENGIDMLITAGENMKHLARGAKDNGIGSIAVFDKTLEVCEFVKKEIKSGDAVLIKASHGMHFEQVYDSIKNN
ncbi:MAG: UDP-N-acetylmuramoyl-tripeptide--D-alanyl-D-alanine ligase [Oscillospiraceae bacterium]|nr:UDP-N-acetylmuramoyl-tripeptide--D-alanyl-D-alanine ligase [Oscillospiraceae bacterium]